MARKSPNCSDGCETGDDITCAVPFEYILQEWADKMEGRFDNWIRRQEQLLQAHMSGMSPNLAPIQALPQNHMTAIPSTASANIWPDTHKGKSARPAASNISAQPSSQKEKKEVSMTPEATTDTKADTTSLRSAAKDPTTSQASKRNQRGVSAVRDQEKERWSVQSKLDAWLAAFKEDAESQKKCHGLGHCLNHRLFDQFILLSIFTNVVIIGVQVDYAARHQVSEHVLFSAAEYAFLAIFTGELLLRLIYLRLRFVRQVENVFDAALVFMQWLEVIIRIAGASGGHSDFVLRVLRNLRILRIIRVLRFFTHLRMMVRMIKSSLKSLFWLMVLLVTIMYAASIVFTAGVSSYLSSQSDAANTDDTMLEPTHVALLEESFGDLPTTVLTLFKAICNGLSWAPLVDELFIVDTSLAIVFLFYIFFVFFSVLNVVTGVFVDGAIQSAGKERALQLANEQKLRADVCMHLIELLSEVDADRTGKITLEEMLASTKNKELHDSFSLLQIDTSDFAQLFAYLDQDGSGEVDVKEFVDGCLRLRGGARSIDLHMLMYKMESENKHLHEKMADMLADLNQDIGLMFHSLQQGFQLNLQSLPALLTVKGRKVPVFPVSL